MIAFVEHNCLNADMINNREVSIVNLSSLLEGYPRINILPPFSVDRTSIEFDRMYFDYIFTNDNVFNEFMKIIMVLYFNNDIIILVTKNDLYELVNESLMKLLQQRYGLISNNINVLDDWNYVVDCEFSLQGLYNLDMDKERYSELYAKDNNLEEG